MSLNKPFKKIIRPFADDSYLRSIKDTYLLAPDYSNERISSIRAFHLIVQDYLDILDYIEPNDNNEKVYSHRIYELFLRTCTEFESNCKSILSSNKFSKAPRDWNIIDYFKINKASKLHEYKVQLDIWGPTSKLLEPFQEWNSTTYAPLIWYRAYNNVKHNRNNNFHDASLENLTLALSALFTIIFSQYFSFSFEPFQLNTSFIEDQRFLSTSKNIFKIQLPSTWIDNEKYDFDWNTLKTTADKFDSFDFDAI
jgi:hypothetical protein